MLEGKAYVAIYMVFQNACGFLNDMTGYTKSPRVTRGHAMYISLMSRDVSGNCN